MRADLAPDLVRTLDRRDDLTRTATPPAATRSRDLVRRPEGDSHNEDQTTNKDKNEEEQEDKNKIKSNKQRETRIKIEIRSNQSDTEVSRYVRLGGTSPVGLSQLVRTDTIAD